MTTASARPSGPRPELAAPAPAGGPAIVFAVAAVWSLAVARTIAVGTVVPWDSKNQVYAFFRFLAGALAAGGTPFWNPYTYGGLPSVADPQSLVWSPVFVAVALVDPAPSLRAFDLLVSAHLLAGGLALAALGRRRGWPAAACVLAAAVFILGGAAAGRLQHTGMILSYAQAPVALLLISLALDRRSYLAALAAGVAAALLVLGRNQAALLLCAVVAAAAVAMLAPAPRPLARLRTRLGVLATMAVTAVAVAAVPMLLTLQLAALSNRPVVTLADALAGSLHPANLATLFAADVLGSHGAYYGPGGTASPDLFNTDDSFNYLFVGGVPMLLLAWLGLGGGGVLARGARLWSAAAALALLYMLGRFTPVFALAFAHVPGVDLFRRPVDGSFVLTLALAMLSGALLAAYVRDGLPRRPWIAGAVAVAALAGLAAVAVRFAQASGHAGHALAALGPAFAVVLAAATVLALGARAGRRDLAAAVVTAIAAAELLGWNAAFRLNAEPREAYAALEAPAGADAAVIAVVDRALAAAHAAGDRPRVEVVGLGGAWQNLAMVRGWEAVNGYNPVRLGAYDRLVAPAEENWRFGFRRFPESFAGFDSPLAREIGLGLLVLGAPLATLPGQPHLPAAEPLLEGPRAWVYRLPGARPRAEVRPAGAARITAWRPDRVAVAVEADGPATLVLHDLLYPGWVAELDGAPAPIGPVAPLFRGVAVPAGRHAVVFRFAPLSTDNLLVALKGLAGPAPAAPAR
ncbi:hypothetical protein PQJ75_29215 [Rhodoplanes sp. TEM]|uniref:YfhO family protein n=1 Tax=Rhodoplanes tepidamans TaxID=200616 RepID=A0ABT5JIY4_RHOTP|nr:MULTISPECIES: hypothetical protein [Rhodoplanes]MDC7789539.1 hypothetical protein [Rhodoplanes tepidamans]MDC7987834.1 hypothetical protein [Rhodoplanes sp. TEM]MDQ0353997.1 hypothetical protein [Rhodoplanes tepidamans]